MKHRVPWSAFDSLSTLPALWAAWRRARKGKRRSLPAARFEVEAERHLLGLHRALRSGHYRPRPFRVHIIRDPKIRAIVLADFADRVLHQAIHFEVGPWFERSHIDHTYACLPGRGTHRAVLRYLGSCRRYRYRLSLDVRRYFLSIDHDILLGLLFDRIEENRLRWLMECSIRCASGLYRHPAILQHVPGMMEDPIPDGVGLPIGTLTSQWCANFYLSGLDHFMLRVLKIPGYQRYMDDLTMFADDRRPLEEAREAAIEWAKKHRRLDLHEAAEVVEAGAPSVYLGFEVRRSGLNMGPKAKRRLRRNLVRAAKLGPEALEATLMAYRGITLFG